MSDLVNAYAMQRRHRVKHRRGMLLRSWRVDCDHAALLSRKNLRSKAKQILEQGRFRIMNELRKRHGAARVLKKAVLIGRILDRVQHAELDLFRAE